MASQRGESAAPAKTGRKGLDKSHYLSIAVIAAVIAAIGYQLSTARFDNQGSPSIDVETMKLKRMIDKRSQMFDMLRQIIDKYNQTAKGVIDSIGR